MELVRMWPVWSICEFQASQDYITRHQLKNKQTNTKTHQNLGSRYGGEMPVTPSGEMEFRIIFSCIVHKLTTQRHTPTHIRTPQT